MKVKKEVDYFQGVYTGTVFNLENSESFRASKKGKEDYKNLFSKCLDDEAEMQKMVQYNVLFNSDYLSLDEFMETLKELKHK